MEVSSYLSGYVDGEGCFCVSFSRSKRHAMGWDIRPSFSVSQNKDRAEVLELLRSQFEYGTIRPDRSDNTLKYEIRSIKPLVEKVIPHFRAYPLLSSKQRDFELFALICESIHRGEHLEVEGLKKIISLAFQMNASGKRKYPKPYILSTIEQDEGIVYALGNKGEA
jgi:hypothetical protein